jgi:hypothetical protein
MHVCDKTAADLKHMSVAQRCGFAFVYLPQVKPGLSQYLERGAFICYCAADKNLKELSVLFLGGYFSARVNTG